MTLSRLKSNLGAPPRRQETAKHLEFQVSPGLISGEIQPLLSIGAILPRVATYDELAHIELLLHRVCQYICPRPSRFILTVFPDEAHHRLVAWKSIRTMQQCEDETPRAAVRDRRLLRRTRRRKNDCVSHYYY